jgi:hypothetical protein
MSLKKYDRILTVDSAITGLMLARDQHGRPMWEVTQVPTLAPQMATGEVSYANAPPEYDLVFQESDWREGLVSGGYGGDDRFRGRISPPPKVSTLTLPDPGDATIKGFVNYRGDLYLAVATGVFKFVSGAWVQILDTGAVVVYCIGTMGEDYILVGFGGGAAYKYSTNGISWIDSTLAGNDKYASIFASIETGTSTTLFKDDSSGLQSSTDPSNTGSWTATEYIGWINTLISEMLSYANKLYIFKTEGLYIYTWDSDTSTGSWVNAGSELESFYDYTPPGNCLAWKNNLYFPIGVNALYYYSPEYGNLDTITPGNYAPEESSFVGQCRALAADEEFLYAFIDNGAYIEILVGRWETIEGKGTDFRWHPWVTLTYADVHCAFVTSTAGGIKKLWFAGHSADGVKYIILPDRYPDLSSVYASYLFDTGWTHYTPKYNGGFIDQYKTWTSLTLKSSGLSGATRAVAASYSLDGGAWTLIGTFNTSPIQTIYISTGTNGISGREIRLKFVGTNGEDVLLHINGFALHGMLRPSHKKMYQFTVLAVDDLTLLDGSVDKQTAAAIATGVRSADRALPITMEDEDGSTLIMAFQSVREAYMYQEKGRKWERVFNITASEVVMS